jgi:Fe-S-cluster containining protein
MITYNTDVDTVLKRAEIVCKDCVHCCQFQGGFVLPEEASRIASHLGIDDKEFIEKFLEPHTRFNTTLFRLKSGKKEKEKPFGPCVFLKKEGCGIQKVKPLHCRVGTCNSATEENNLWYSLRYFLNPSDEVSMREYAMYLKTGGKTLPGANLHELVPDKKKINKLLNYEPMK